MKNKEATVVHSVIFCPGFAYQGRRELNSKTYERPSITQMDGLSALRHKASSNFTKNLQKLTAGRRLFGYVPTTRSCILPLLCYGRHRYKHGQFSTCKSSTFVDLTASTTFIYAKIFRVTSKHFCSMHRTAPLPNTALHLMAQYNLRTFTDRCSESQSPSSISDHSLNVVTEASETAKYVSFLW